MNTNCVRSVAISSKLVLVLKEKKEIVPVGNYFWLRSRLAEVQAGESRLLTKAQKQWLS